jgi:hypothetical protein
MLLLTLKNSEKGCGSTIEPLHKYHGPPMWPPQREIKRTPGVTLTQTVARVQWPGVCQKGLF